MQSPYCVLIIIMTHQSYMHGLVSDLAGRLSSWSSSVVFVATFMSTAVKCAQDVAWLGSGRTPPQPGWCDSHLGIIHSTVACCV